MTTGATKEATTSANSINLSFFDVSNPSKLVQLLNPQVEITISEKKTVKVSLSDGENGTYTGPLKPVEDAVGKTGLTDGVTLQIRLAAHDETGCQKYTGSPVSFFLKSPVKSICIPMPLQQVQQACRIDFKAVDDDDKDFDENAKFFLNSVEWTVTAINAPVSAHGTKPVFKPFTASVRSVEGSAEITELPLHQLYRIDTRGPKGYTSKEPSVDFRYICCENQIEINSSFSPCGSKPTRSVIFVQQACSGKRWGVGQKVSIAGQLNEISANGILDVPPDLDGMVPISAPGYVFSPAMLDLRKDAPPVITVTASDETAAESAFARGLFVDESNVPFVNRPITMLLPNGREVQTMTDDEGFFDAPEGSQVFAAQHDSGPATEMIIVAPMHIDVIEGRRRPPRKIAAEAKK